ncbi:hypothetical protein OFR29_07540 [Brachyspira hyodysenteriae]|uniref:hypothetical protein n=1 Tax=Brachyspira hyodysenteriae TaxID=159 RepID=UPI0022CD65C1|nr:hypothetical protein [Brachyspira hyodysenteriae]MCZ9892140.1 hypothetical protein [Brachyspira hyodysenteriae]MCZ9989689.1 hypothetical protein [Brachyspira hyodysenteriae]MCZ9998056.1 hypothetical protein [Brachyspira hyodysenteriae]MDA0001490.1 hypothetical protein [Brachyspira hyodysenteriae]MDA0006500.1 hypothetical protein [Brachyspira hyodysenteriae]
MKNILKLIVLNLVLACTIVYGQSPYTDKDQKVLKGAIDVWPYIGIEYERPTESYMPFDYIHESHKRENRLKKSFPSRLLYELSTIELHMNTLIGVNLREGHFSMPNMYLSLGKSFHFDWIFSATPFVTMTSKFDVFNKDYATGSIGLYDAGIETVTLTRILLSFRMKAVNDINGSTFMLLPSVIDSESASFAPHWYIPRVNNEMGFRAGFIGSYYELSYSQGFSQDSNPLAAVFKINGDYFRAQLLYQYNNKNSLSPENFISRYNKNNIHNKKEYYTHHLVQLSGMGRIPFLDKELWLNLLGEYTWRDNDAHYVRLELGLEWKMLNIAIRPLFYIPANYYDDDDDNIYAFDPKKDLFCLEYSVYVKFDPVYFGFQGSTDGRYYIAMKAVF